ncbi:MAG: hypothetical protein AB8B56_17080 [Crocinitomicaceae bacterium]
MNKVILFFGLLLSAGFLTGCFSTPSDDDRGLFGTIIDKAKEKAEKESEADKKTYTLDENNSIRAIDLINAYDGNEIRADKEFKDKEFEVIGKITEIETDLMTELPVIDLRGSGLLDFMQCHFESTEGLEILNIGDVVKVTGTCSGKDMFVEMTQCTVTGRL